MRRAVLCLFLTGIACDEPPPDGPAELSTRDSLGRPLGPLARERAHHNDEFDAAFNLLARVEVQPGELFEVHEPAPGVLLLSSAGAASVAVSLLAAHAFAAAALTTIAKYKARVAPRSAVRAASQKDAHLDPEPII